MGSENHPKTQPQILTLLGHPSIREPQRRSAPITVRQNRNAVRYELESVSDLIGIRTHAPLARKSTRLNVALQKRLRDGELSGLWKPAYINEFFLSMTHLIGANRWHRSHSDD
jgi:hypothetical protein